MQTLTQSQLEQTLKTLPHWTLEDGTLTRTFTFPDFLSAIDFVNKLAPEAEKAGHHPDIDIRYNKVKLALVTHDSGGITRKDAEMAKTADSI